MNSLRSRLSESRNEIKGIAILWVIFFHAQLGLTGPLGAIQKIGYGGVDIFFFLSGFGLYRSLEKDADFGRYLARRARRLLPSYLPFCLVWLIVMIPLAGLGTVDAVRTVTGNVFMTAFFAGAPLQINWYVSALAMTILAAPVFFAVIGRGEKDGLRAAGLLITLFTAGLAFIGKDAYMAVSRLPIFALGMLAAKPRSKEPRGGVAAAVLLVCFAAGALLLKLAFARPWLLNDYAMYWHPFVLITPGLCAGLALVMTHLPGVVRRPFAALGRASFEIFLFNAWAELAGKRFGLCRTPLDWALWSLASIAAGLACERLIRLMRLRRKK